MFGCTSVIEWSNLHLGESQRVIIPSPVNSRDSVSIGRRYAFQVGAVQVRLVTYVVPPSTFVRHRACTWPDIIVLVSSAEFVSALTCQ